jgi:SAM-dependent methyltransferase
MNLNTIFYKIKCIYVRHVYADHNDSTIVKKKLSEILKRQDENAKIINIGSGNSRIDKRIINIDVQDGPQVDIVADAKDIKLPDNSVDLIISQETFEHIRKKNIALNECYRILKKNGLIYLQVPFTIGFHDGPEDFWRFSKDGIEEFLLNKNFEIIEKNVTTGSAVGFYRIAVEFFSIIFSGPIHFLYKPLKGIFALILFPIKFLEFWTKLSVENDRIAGGYYIIGKKI